MWISFSLLLLFSSCGPLLSCAFNKDWKNNSNVKRLHPIIFERPAASTLDRDFTCICTSVSECDGAHTHTHTEVSWPHLKFMWLYVVLIKGEGNVCRQTLTSAGAPAGWTRPPSRGDKSRRSPGPEGEKKKKKHKVLSHTSKQTTGF